MRVRSKGGIPECDDHKEPRSGNEGTLTSCGCLFVVSFRVAAAGAAAAVDFQHWCAAGGARTIRWKVPCFHNEEEDDWRIRCILWILLILPLCCCDLYPTNNNNNNNKLCGVGQSLQPQQPQQEFNDPAKSKSGGASDLRFSTCYPQAGLISGRT